MSNRNGLQQVVIYLGLLVGLFLSSVSVAQDNSGISVIVNASVNTTQMTAIQLRQIFTARQSIWPDGQPIQVFVFESDNQSHQIFCKNVLRVFPYQIERTWDKLTYSGLGERPLALKDKQTMLDMIKRTPGAIGYVANGVLPKDVKIIRVTKD